VYRLAGRPSTARAKRDAHQRRPPQLVPSTRRVRQPVTRAEGRDTDLTAACAGPLGQIAAPPQRTACQQQIRGTASTSRKLTSVAQNATFRYPFDSPSSSGTAAQSDGSGRVGSPLHRCPVWDRLGSPYETPRSSTAALWEQDSSIDGPVESMPEGDVMDVQFIASVAVITPDPSVSRRLYVDALGLPLTASEGDDYLHSEDIDGSKHFGV
jgi:hypothetical protein